MAQEVLTRLWAQQQSQQRSQTQVLAPGTELFPGITLNTQSSAVFCLALSPLPDSNVSEHPHRLSI